MNWSSEWGFVTSVITISIVINDGDFPTQVEAIQVGDLAVHRNLRKYDSSEWQVTHVPTLARFNVVPAGLHKQSDLIEWCKKVQAKLPEDWKSLNELTSETYSGRSEAKDRVMQLCQGVPIDVK